MTALLARMDRRIELRQRPPCRSRARHEPVPMVWADIRALRWTALAIIVLVALAVAVGVAIGAQERALRRSSAAAAEDFDLLIGAPGSQTQLLMSAVYLQPDAVPLMDGRLLNTLAQDERVAGFAPIAFGDVSKGYVIVGTTAAFAGRWGGLAPIAGPALRKRGRGGARRRCELWLGDNIAPSHGVARRNRASRRGDQDEAGHRHAGHDYVAVGRLPRLGSPWDRAILVPIESVWEIHGLGNGHAVDDGRIGPPFDGPRIPGVPALVVKPRSVAGAYALRAQYRQGGTMAFFPAEVLVTLYRALGDVRSILVARLLPQCAADPGGGPAAADRGAGLRRRRYAILRALGAPRGYVLLVVWLGMAALMALRLHRRTCCSASVVGDVGLEPTTR
jgi:putative ABC transport system permease protein